MGSRRGIALVMAVSMVMLLVVLVGAMVLSASHSKAISDNYLADLQNTYAARSAYYHALLYLKVDTRDSGNVDSLHEAWARPISLSVGAAQVTIRIEDNERKFNLARLTKTDGSQCPATVEVLRRLFARLNQDPDRVDRIADYVDEDSSGTFEASARNRNGMLYTFDELLRVEGLPRSALYGQQAEGGEVVEQPLEKFVTVWPREAAACSGTGDLAVNLNTAPIELIQSLAEKLSDRTAQDIVAWRQGVDAQGNPNAFTSISDVKSEIPSIDDETLEELKKFAVFKSATFTITVTSKVGTLGKEWVYVVKRAGGSEPIKLLAQYRRTELKEFPKPEEP